MRIKQDNLARKIMGTAQLKMQIIFVHFAEDFSMYWWLL
jgi:hypothetical protein